MSALLITGTDTNVGKTWVACALVQALRARGRRVGVMKPVETGVVTGPEDALRLQAAADDPAPLTDICPYQLPDPLAPTVAAARAGVSIDVDRIAALIAQRATTVDTLVIEGAGGLLVPIVARMTFLDLAVRCGLPLVIVAANRLGTVNHAALTARVALAAGVQVRGFVLSHPTSTTDVSAASNRASIEDLTGLPCLGELRHGSREILDLRPFELGA